MRVCFPFPVTKSRQQASQHSPPNTHHTTPAPPPPMSTPEAGIWESISRAHAAIRSLSDVLGRALPDSLTYSETPASCLLHDPEVADEISTRLRQRSSGAGDDNLCRWLYDTFQSMDPDLQLTVLSFVPTVAGVYLSRAISREPLPGFEAVLLALYAHETVARGGQPVTVSIPNMSHPSLYHETTKSPTKNKSVELQLGVISPTLEPHGTVRATKRARIVGVALELYCAKILSMPVRSKMEFCEFCVAWAGQGAGEKPAEGEDAREGICQGEGTKKAGRIPLPWELLQPTLRILGHCLMGPSESDELRDKATAAVQCLHARAMHDMVPQAILATRSLVRLREMNADQARRSVDWSGLEEVCEADSVAIGST